MRRTAEKYQLKYKPMHTVGLGTVYTTTGKEAR